MPIRSRPIEPEKPNPYLNTPIPPLIMEQFQGIDTYTTRPGVDDKQCWWIDGFICLNERNLRTLYGPTLFKTFDDPIAFFDFANIGADPFVIVIHNNGKVTAVNTATGLTTVIAPAGTIQNPSVLNTDVTQYGSQYILIISTQTNGYFIWDGTTFWFPGDVAPFGTMPTGISGTGIETYQGRVWIINGADLTFSAPGSVVLFASGGGGSVTSTDSFLRVHYTALIQTNGFLYLIGDSSVSYISGVQTSGSPPVTIFTQLNADPEVGTAWPPTVTTFGRSIVFANAFGAHINYGAAVTKISDPLNGVYNTVPMFGGLIPSSAKSILFGIKVWMLLLPIIDPITAQQVNKLMIWDGKKWFASGQGIPLTYIQHQEIDSILTAWGTDGTNLYTLFTTPSNSYEKIVQSKFWDKPVGYQATKTVGRAYGMAKYYNFNHPNVLLYLDNENGSAGPVTLVPPQVIPVINAAGHVIPTVNAMGEVIVVISSWDIAPYAAQAIGQQGKVIGMTAKTFAEDMSIISLMFQPEIARVDG
jgi:hypothetical protein